MGHMRATCQRPMRPIFSIFLLHFSNAYTRNPSVFVWLRSGAMPAVRSLSRQNTPNLYIERTASGKPKTAAHVEH